jgi:hypothetical protein
MNGSESTTAGIDGARVVPADQWDAVMAEHGVDDAYLHRGWHDASVHLEVDGTREVLLHVPQSGGSAFLPLLVRPLPGGDGFDATSAYGYGGPVAVGDVDLDAFGASLDEWARDAGVVATFLRFHPVLGNHRLCPPAATLVELGSTVAWRTEPGPDLMAGMHSHHRRAARKAERAGVQVRVTEAPTDLAAFRELYDLTMRRQDAADFYFFGDAYWDALVAGGGGGELVLVDAVMADDETPVASLLCVAGGGWLHYHLGASADAARNIGASNACFLAAAQWAQERGIVGFHLGGGVGGGSDSPLFTFKHRYDPASEPLPFHVAKLVHDSGRYREIAGTDSTDGFFPPWRAPS